MSVLAAGALMAPAGASADPIPDANCVDDGVVSETATAQNELATTFRVLQGGYLARVRLFLRHSSPGSTYVIRILAVDGSLVPTTNILAQTTVPDSAIPISPTPAEVVADFPTPPAVHASSHYAISISRQGTDSLGWEIYPGNPAPCPNSEQYVRTGSSSTFTLPHPANATDVHFQTYLTDGPGPITCLDGSIPVNGNCPTPQATQPTINPPAPAKKHKKKKKKKRKKRKRGK